MNDALYTQVIEQIKQDIENQDYTAIYDLLERVPEELVQAYLPEWGTMKEVKDISVSDMTVSEALQHLEAKVDAIIQKLDRFEEEDPYVSPGSDCQV